MERANGSYSLKNIAILSKNAYLKNIFKLERFMKSVRWKPFFYEKSEDMCEMIDDNFGFKSVRTPTKMNTLFILN